jgi:predicted RNase H-like nuclease (RuvC/YqgF family)
MGITEGRMTMIVAGIDPGLTGAIAILSLLWGE